MNLYVLYKKLFHYKNKKPPNFHKSGGRLNTLKRLVVKYKKHNNYEFPLM
nr:MAG TPA: hypothetical protein [Caudoviricetes sp.]